MNEFELRKLDVRIAELLGWKIEREQVPDIDNLDRATRTIALYKVTDAEGTTWSPCHSLDDVGLLHYSICYDASFNAAKALGLFGQQQNGLDVVLYCAGGEWLVCGIDWPFEEMNAIASASTIPLVICLALIELSK